MVFVVGVVKEVDDDDEDPSTRNVGSAAIVMSASATSTVCLCPVKYDEWNALGFSAPIS